MGQIFVAMLAGVCSREARVGFAMCMEKRVNGTSHTLSFDDSAQEPHPCTVVYRKYTPV